MKRIEDIKKFEDIDTYYEISKIVDEVFQDRVEVHKHLVIANEEIERLTENNKAMQEELCKVWDERDNTYRIINELEKWLEERLDKLDINGYDDDVFNGIELALYKLQELKGSNKENV